MKKSLIYDYLNDDELLRISNKIKEMEKLTAGEICVSIKENVPVFKRKKSIKELAQEEFFKLGIQNTVDDTGILIYILFGRREFYILADKGINEIVPQDTWDKIKDEMHQKFSKGEFSKGIINAVERVGKILAGHFPVKPDDINEISNRVII